jgi:hypothetical protein
LSDALITLSAIAEWQDEITQRVGLKIAARSRSDDLLTPWQETLWQGQGDMVADRGGQEGSVRRAWSGPAGGKLPVGVAGAGVNHIGSILFCG